MNEMFSLRGRAQSREEEIANSVSHGVGLMAAVTAAPVLVVFSARSGDTAGVVGASVFAVTTVLVYLASTLYHVLPRSPVKQTFQVLDHAAIFLMIAGTYTPFALGVLRGPLGSTLLGLEWGLATAGVLFKAIWGVRYQQLSVVFYLVMGWLVFIAARPAWGMVPPWGRFWLLAGGIAYTVGMTFFAAHRVRYHHFIWHLFVMTGTVCHFIAVLWYAT